MTLTIPPDRARRVVVARQGFATRARTASVAEVEATIARLGCVQIDSVSAVERSHRLTLASRVGRLPAGALNTLRRSGRVFEYWAHEACLLPVADYRYFDDLRRRQLHPWFGPVLTEHRALADAVLQAIGERGPLSARAFGGAGKGFWEWTPAKRVFEALWTAGELAVAERRGFERMYDLADRVIPAEHRAPAPDEEEVLRYLIVRTVRARGIVTRSRLGDYYRVKGAGRRLAAPLASLIAEGALVRCRVGDHDAVCDPAAAAALDEPPSPSQALLLSPFDNLVWDREESRRLFGFDHVLEIYKPAPQRVFGYYVLPLLVADRIVGRADVRADRKAGVVRVLAMHWEGRPAPAQLARALGRLGQVLDLEPVGPPARGG